MERDKFIWSKATLIALVTLGIILGLGLMIPVSSTVFGNRTGNKNAKNISNENSIPKAKSQKRIEKFRSAMLNTWQKQAIEKGLSYKIPPRFRGVTINQAKVPKGKKVIALTFDDGPWNIYTEQILDILEKHEVKATFFVLAQVLQRNADLGRRIVDDGHTIANHTWHHWYHRHNPQTAANEINRSSDLIYKITGAKTTLFRPPGGILHNGLAAYAKKKNYTVVMWSADSNDYRRPPVPTLVNKVVKQATPGGIILLHDGGGNRSNTVASLVPIIQKLKQQGYKFVTIPELLEVEDKALKLAEARKKKAAKTKAKSANQPVKTKQQ
ncbi:polysaccharide deacetylase family protein [Calothrix rhizosoleniae]|uniref:polysaccharide deacetylase family protein n=1 Tax=Calothrix rhizosoleniae TaxID=888997 RepID=UPI000B4A2483|nr:polysaccharide deacetylase family protein [Calothrix rhizosoleniae]